MPSITNFRSRAILLGFMMLAASWPTMWNVIDSASASPGSGACGEIDLDVMLFLDSSGSMGSEINDLRYGFASLVATLSATYDVRIGIAVFGHHYGGDPENQSPVKTDGSLNPNVVIPLSTDPAPVQNLLNAITAFGGWEPWGDTIYMLNHDIAWRPNALKIGVIATDEPVNEGRRVPGPLNRASGAYYDGPALYAEVNLASANGIVISTVDTAGSGLVTAQLQSIASLTGGTYRFLPHGSGGFTDAVTNAIVKPAGEAYRYAYARGLVGHANVPANPVVTLAPTATSQRPATAGGGTDFARLLHVPIPAVGTLGDGTVDVFESYASQHGSATRSTAFAQANATRVTLLGGLVAADVVHVESRVRIGEGTPASASAAGSFIANVSVGATSIPLVTSPMTITLPGVGVVHLLYIVESAPSSPNPALHVEGIRVETTSASERTVTSVAVAEAGVGCGSPPALVPWVDDDAGLGGDAGGSPGNAAAITTPALFAGRLGAGGDVADAYRFSSTGPGEAISVTVTPAARVESTLNELPSDPEDLAPYALASTVVTLPRIATDLISPTGDVVESHETLASEPVFFEFNPHVAGEWTLRVRPLASGIMNYTVSLATYPLPVFAQDGTLAGSDLPSTCGAGPAIGSGAFTGALYGTDFADTIRVQVPVGKTLHVGLKGSENVDGARFGLHVWDPTCTTSVSGGIPVGPEGSPRSVIVPTSVLGGAYSVIVTRDTLAVGNYYLDIAVTP